MIKEMLLHQIGPVSDLRAEFGPRLNMITGDNGLGKTFLLDACWYALTRTWADGRQFYPLPHVPKKDPPFIEYAVIGKTGRPAENRADYRFADQSWKGQQARPAIPGLVLYARIDGGFSVWDPARNYWHDGVEGPQRPPAFQFSKKEVWEGLDEESEGQKKPICNGLLRDVETWRLKSNGAFHLLQKILETISSPEEGILAIGESVRVRLDDSRDIPTLKMRYGDIPVTQTAAGMRRVLALAYLLVWAWEEHLRVSQLKKEPPTDRIVFLFDEVEAHLHPKWQRVFLPSLIEVVNALLTKGQAQAVVGALVESPRANARSLIDQSKPQTVQVIATTHAPLVLASMETYFDEATDKLFLFEVEGKNVQFRFMPWSVRGDACAWLRSPLFGLLQARSKEAEEAIEVAEKWMREERSKLPGNLNSQDKIHERLTEVLPEFDPFWPRWIVKRGGSQ